MCFLSRHLLGRSDLRRAPGPCGESGAIRGRAGDEEQEPGALGLATDRFKAEAAVQGRSHPHQSRRADSVCWGPGTAPCPGKRCFYLCSSSHRPHRATHRVSCLFSPRIFVFIKLQNFRDTNPFLSTEETGVEPGDSDDPSVVGRIGNRAGDAEKM